MKRITALLLALCLLAAVPAFAEVLTEGGTVTFDAFSFDTPVYSYLQRGETGAPILFIYYPQYGSGDTSSNITVSVDDLTAYDPVTMTATMRDQFGAALLEAATSQLSEYGFTVANAEYKWDEGPTDVAGTPGYVIRISYDIEALGQSVTVISLSCLVCHGAERYNFAASGMSGENARALLDDFFASFRWN
jgi:hypothetical protein